MLKEVKKFFKNLCTPSYVYLMLSLIFLLVASVQNYGNINNYCLGDFSCDVTSTSVIFLIKIMYILFWTWILNLMCNAGATSIAWFLVLLPFILLFIMLVLASIR